MRAATRQPAADVFGEVLRRYRVTAGLTQEELAARAALSAHGISDLERGARTHPYPATVVRLAQALGLSEADRAALQGAARRETRAESSPAASATQAQAGPGLALALPLTSFIGRERDLAEIQDLLSSVRLLTLVGTGGVGKTRLAFGIAADSRAAYADGVYAVDLAPLTDESLVAHTVLTALGARELPGQQPVDAIVSLLRTRMSLLVLDNCEHLATACAKLVDTVLRSCAGVRVLATSREHLGLSGETVWRVPSLSVPDMHEPRTAVGLSRHASVQLFEQRARLVNPSFELTDLNAPAVAQVCIRLDGIPLAIELAAARAHALTVEDLVARLSDRFHLLTSGSPTALPRQQTLQATIDWSFALLEEAERHVFRRLAVFAGGWEAETAEMVCGGDGVETNRVLDLLSQLVSKSLVVADTRGRRTRYWMLETIRQYASDKLSAGGEDRVIGRRHRDWYLDLAERADAAEVGREQRPWLERCELEHDNFRAALEWCQSEPAGAPEGIRMAGALARFWHWRGHVTEGRGWLLRALSRDGGTPAARSHALTLASLLEWRYGSTEVARDMVERSFELASVAGDADVLARALRYRAYYAGALGHYTAAEIFANECLSVAQAGGARREEAWALAFIGLLFYLHEDLQRAHEPLQAALTIGHELGDRITINSALVQLGAVAVAEGQYDLAHTLHAEALVVAQELSFRLGIGDALMGLGDVALGQGDVPRAASLYREALQCLVQAGERRQLAAGVERVGGLCVANGDFAAAARLFAAAAAHFEVAAGCMPHRSRGRHASDLAIIRGGTDRAVFQAQWDAGGVLSLERAAEYALEACDETGRSGPMHSSVADEPVLTLREHEVLRVLARGASNRQIAEALSVGVRTAETHVERILRKLDLENRHQAMLWARDHDPSALSSNP